ncbi:hypothetical protein HYV64_02070 [Candidatus Shapirobacteria bacterium]|nr:hypothetical protein [Candidatus Shapirobacteria bacterium]
MKNISIVLGYGVYIEPNIDYLNKLLLVADPAIPNLPRLLKQNLSRIYSSNYIRNLNQK